MSNACPLNFQKVDENVSRISALFVATLVVAYLLLHNVFVLYFLVLDFVLRLFVNRTNSPIILSAQFFKNILNIQEKLVDGGAKKLAGFFGLFFVVLLLLAHYFTSWGISMSVAAIFLLCSLLDVFFNYCLGCKIYHIIRKFYPNFMDDL